MIDLPILADPVIRMRYSLVGTGEIQIDHGAALYGAISSIVPQLHGTEVVGISPIEGGYVVGNQLRLDRTSHFYIQIPSSVIPLALQLAGKQLLIGDLPVRVGIPQLTLLTPSSQLYARIVSIKGKMDEESVTEYIHHLIRENNHSDPDLQLHIEILRRRVVSIHGKNVVGFGVKVLGLTEKLSLWLQEVGMGGRRRYGCGFFIKCSRESGW